MRAIGSILQAGRGRWWRAPYVLVLVYLFVVIAFNAALLTAVGFAQVVADDPRVSGPGFPAIKHLRPIDDKLWFGAQPNRQKYRALAEMGIEVVVDLRIGVKEDPRDDDPEFLRTLGIDYEWLPIPDGQTPNRAEVDSFVEIVRSAPGQVFAHSGGGVGRDVALAAAYNASLGRHPSLLESLVIGPPTLEQTIFIWDADPEEPVPDLGLVEWFSRVVVDAPRIGLSWLRARVML